MNATTRIIICIDMFFCAKRAPDSEQKLRAIGIQLKYCTADFSLCPNLKNPVAVGRVQN